MDVEEPLSSAVDPPPSLCSAPPGVRGQRASGPAAQEDDALSDSDTDAPHVQVIELISSSEDEVRPRLHLRFSGRLRLLTANLHASCSMAAPQHARCRLNYADAPLTAHPLDRHASGCCEETERQRDRPVSRAAEVAHE